jgi:hypothetical protein
MKLKDKTTVKYPVALYQYFNYQGLAAIVRGRISKD